MILACAGRDLGDGPAGLAAPLTGETQSWDAPRFTQPTGSQGVRPPDSAAALSFLFLPSSFPPFPSRPPPTSLDSPRV